MQILSGVEHFWRLWLPAKLRVKEVWLPDFFFSFF